MYAAGRVPTVRVGGLSFEGQPQNLNRCFVIPPEGLSGWDDGTSTRRNETSRPSAHGSFAAPVYQGSRVISISGWAYAESGEVLGWMSDRLSGLLADGSVARMTVDMPGDTKWADVQLAGQTSIVRRSPYQYVFDYQIQFWAADPRRYGKTNTFPESGTTTGSVSVYHYGNFPSSPRILVSNATAAYTVTTPNGTFAISGATAGGTHEIDMKTGRVYRNGSLMLGVSSGRTWDVIPGVPQTVTVSGGLSFQVKVLDTFI